MLNVATGKSFSNVYTDGPIAIIALLSVLQILQIVPGTLLCQRITFALSFLHALKSMRILAGPASVVRKQLEQISYLKIR